MIPDFLYELGGAGLLDSAMGILAAVYDALASLLTGDALAILAGLWELLMC